MNLYKVLFSILGTILIGYFSKQKKLFNDTHVHAFEIFLLKIGMPCYLFSVTLRQDLNVLLNFKFIFSYLASFFAMFLLGLYLNKKYTLVKSVTMSVASGYSNTAMYTTPVIFFLFENAIAGVIANLIQVLIIQLFFLIILTFLHGCGGLKVKIKKIFITPIIILPLLGVLLNYLKADTYLKNATDVIENLGTVATGLALFTFGLNLGKVNFVDALEKSQVLRIVLMKNLCHPVFAFFIGYFIFKLDKYWLSSLIVSASAPTAFVIYVISKEYGVEANIIRSAVVLTSLFSVFTLSTGIVIAKLINIF